jgi:8-oxo-dGTP diphosphatase
MIYCNSLCIKPLLLASALFIAGCTQPPPCPTNISSTPSVSAGCMVIENNKLLVAQTHSGIVSIPGGRGNTGEPSHCTAHRETWEETGLDVTPTELIRTFDHGFQLYRCRWPGAQAQTSAPFVLEIDKAFWIEASEFKHYSWRFPEQTTWLLQKMSLDEGER